ncbi:unnamed protein product [Candidula unifasciata]|uniref:SH3 domain-containing protein n=1 Tax=Candidula unifasciata TaxID=100452 RepID=A0A8S3ZMH7_9EUPU|nr:unnamed protein product [Candidula unifasciata]
MKSFSLEMPDPPKQLLGIDEVPKKSPSFTSSSFDKSQTSGAGPAAVKKRIAFSSRSPSVETEDSKDRSRTPSPELSPKIKKKEEDVYVSLYHFRAKEKDDMDLRPGSRVTVKTKSKTDWWKGKCNGRSGYFPAKYLLKLEKYQRVYQVNQTLNLTELDGIGLRLHKDQIVVGVGETESNPTTVHVRTANKREALCPVQFLAEV